MRRAPRCSTVLALALCSLSCGPPQVKLAPGAQCARTVVAGSGTPALLAALASAARGTCVVAAPGRYAAAFSVPAGVTLAAAVGTTVEITGSAAASAAVTLGEGATLSGVRVLSAPGVGVWVGPGARLVSVLVKEAGGAGVLSWCEEDCRVAEAVELHGVELLGNAVGLLVHGARVRTFGGSVSESRGTTLASGYGVTASHGAVLEMVGTVVERNEELGVLIDGSQGTEASLEDVTVRENRGRGVWAQAVAGTLAEPRLRLTSCTIEGNRLVGLGARASSGIRIQGGRVAGTVMGQASSSVPGVLVDVGDGIGLFERTGDVHVEGVALDSNARSQTLIDQGAARLTLQNTTVTAQVGQLGVVVQRTVELVQAPQVFTPPPGQELAISAPALSLPTR